ncbi:MAG: hypothetical protein KatS3mg095_0311 [Candidatus Parcubacteria bacterium]|nr:MAG: hypothetical protein KatS3mg095_0311 [Candidatus Parcubacteria bacterium]
MKKIIFVFLIISLSFNLVYGQSNNFEDLKNNAKNKLEQIRRQINSIKTKLKINEKDNRWEEDCGLYNSGGPLSSAHGDINYLSELIDKLKDLSRTIDNHIHDLETTTTPKFTLNKILEKIGLLNYICSDTSCGDVSPGVSPGVNNDYKYFGFHLLDPLTKRIFLAPYSTTSDYSGFDFYRLKILTNPHGGGVSTIMVSIPNDKNFMAGYLREFKSKIPYYIDYLESYKNFCFLFDALEEESQCKATIDSLEEEIDNATDTEENRGWINYIVNTSSKLILTGLLSNDGILMRTIDMSTEKGILYYLSEQNIDKETVYLNNIKTAANNIKNKSNNFNDVYNDFIKNVCDKKALKQGVSFGGAKLEETINKINRKLEEAFFSVLIKTEPVEISLKVIPPIVFSDDHKGEESFKQITPERIFNEIKDFLFSLAPIVFILLLIIGAIFYILSPIKIEYIRSGSEYIKWAIIGYFLLLIISAIFTAIKTIFGGP